RVPNMGSLIAGFCLAIDFTHITHFTQHSLTQVLEASGFNPDMVCLQRQAPRLFWSITQPHKALFRLLNRVRWHLNNAVHRAVYILTDMHPRPSVFDPNLVITANK